VAALSEGAGGPRPANATDTNAAKNICEVDQIGYFFIHFKFKFPFKNKSKLFTHSDRRTVRRRTNSLTPLFAQLLWLSLFLISTPHTHLRVSSAIHGTVDVRSAAFAGAPRTGNVRARYVAILGVRREHG
jgi:hypothetical protein